MPISLRPLEDPLPDEEPDLLVMQIGDREHLEQPDATRMNEELLQVERAWIAALGAYKTCRVAFTVGGYDQDERAIWEIPEAALRFRELARRLFPSGYAAVIRNRLEETTIAVLCQCGCWGTDHPFDVRILP